MKRFLAGVLASATLVAALLLSVVALAQDGILALARPLVVDVRQSVPIIADVVVPLDDGTSITATVPLTLDIALQVGISGVVSDSVQVIESEPETAISEAASISNTPELEVSFQVWESSDVVSAFQTAGLEVGETRPMTKDDYGMAPYVAVEGIRFLIPSLGEEKGGRIMSFATPRDLELVQTFFVDLGKASAMLYSHVFTKENILVQINGDLPDDQAAEYDAVLQTMSK